MFNRSAAMTDLPFRRINEDGAAPIVIICDHASNRVPAPYGDAFYTGNRGKRRDLPDGPARLCCGAGPAGGCDLGRQGSANRRASLSPPAWSQMDLRWPAPSAEAASPRSQRRDQIPRSLGNLGPGTANSIAHTDA